MKFRHTACLLLFCLFISFCSGYSFAEDKIKKNPTSPETKKQIRKPMETKNIGFLKKMIKAGTDIHIKDEYDKPLLYFAVKDSNFKTDQQMEEFFELMILKGADANSREYYGITPLHHACIKNSVKGIEILIKHGADVHSNDGCGDTPLHYAVLGDNVKGIRILVKNGANIEAKNDEGLTPLCSVTRFQERPKALEALLEKGADLNVKYTGIEKILDQAIWRGHKNIVKILLEKKVDIDYIGYYGRTPLQTAIISNKFEIVKMLISSGAKINQKNKSGYTALMRASGYLYSISIEEQKKLVEILISKGSDLNMQSNRGNTALHCAILPQNNEIVELLLSNGAKVNIKNNEGFTPLHLAITQEDEELIDTLLSCGADIHSMANDGTTPLTTAIYKQRYEIVKKLLKKDRLIKMVVLTFVILIISGVAGYSYLKKRKK